jgi:hypothetical protein
MREAENRCLSKFCTPVFGGWHTFFT